MWKNKKLHRLKSNRNRLWTLKLKKHWVSKATLHITGVSTLSSSLEKKWSEQQAEGLLRGAAKFQVNMSIAYGLLIPAFDAPVVFYFEKLKIND